MEKEKKKSKLKIIIPIAVAIVVVAVVGIIVLSSNKKITLTNDNYEQYLKVISSVNKDSKYTVYLGINYFNNSNQVSTEEEYKKVTMSGSAKGLSSNYIYEDVEITIHFYGTLPLRELKSKGVYNSKYATIPPTFGETGESVTIDKTITIKCDSSGNVISNSENSYTEETKENTYFSGTDIENNIKKDITVKGKIREVK